MQNTYNKYIPLFLILYALSYNSANLYAAQAQPSKQEKTGEEKLPTSIVNLIKLLDQQLKLPKAERDPEEINTYDSGLRIRVYQHVNQKKNDDTFFPCFQKNYPEVYEYVQKKHPESYPSVEGMRLKAHLRRVDSIFSLRFLFG